MINENELKFIQTLYDTFDGINVMINHFTSMYNEFDVPSSKVLEYDYAEIEKLVDEAQNILHKMYGKYILENEERREKSFKINVKKLNYELYDIFNKLEDEME